MADRLEFQGKLGWILEEAKRQDNRIRKEEIEKYFEDDHLSDEQMELVYDYLLSQKVAVSGYERKHGRILTEEEREKSYSEEEKRYLRNYQMELREVQGEQKRLSEFLEKVLGIAESVHDGSVFLGDLVQEGIEELHIKCFNQEHECNNLSGGNQQKVVFAKWIYTNPRVLILDEPTRGVDIGAKKEIYTIINELVEKGVAIIMVQSELPEGLGMSDRIMVVREGLVRGVLQKEEANQENIMILATGGSL